MLSLIPKPELKAADIKLLRTYSSASIAEIRAASAGVASIRDFHIFKGDWQNERLIIAQLYRLMVETGDSVPFFFQDETRTIETTEDLRNRLEGWREIELQTQRDTDLEEGFIKSPEEFVPHDEDWF